jgi:hypothetical protein
MHAKLLSNRTTLSNPAKILCLPGAAIKTNQRREKPLAVDPAKQLEVPLTTSLDFTPAVHGSVTMVLGAQNWDNGHAGGSGSFTVTAISATRVAGTFTVTVVSNLNAAPVPASRSTATTIAAPRS